MERIFKRKLYDRVEQRYLIYTKDLKRDMETLLLPVYMTQFLCLWLFLVIFPNFAPIDIL